MDALTRMDQDQYPKISVLVCKLYTLKKMLINDKVDKEIKKKGHLKTCKYAGHGWNNLADRSI